MKKITAIFASLTMMLQSGCALAQTDTYESNIGTISLDTMSVTGEGIASADGTVSITKGGDFTVTGKCEDGMIYVNTDDKVKLRLSGMSLKNDDGPAIFFENSDKSLITVTADTENYIEDGREYSVDAKAAIFSNDDMEIKGGGVLSVKGNFKHGIASDDDLVIENGSINITAVKDGIHVNNDFTMTDGSLEISAESDGIQAEQAVVIDGGIVNVSKCEEGIESGTTLTINGGTIDITASDDGLNSGGGNGSTGNMNGGMHGSFNRQASPDGQLPNDGQAPMDGERIPGGMRNQRPEDLQQSSENRQMQANTNSSASDNSAEQLDCTLYINGGKITINAGGDGVDSNGDIYMKGGELYVNGPTSNGDGAIDANSFIVTGGTVIAVGASAMAMGVSTGSTQQGILCRLDQAFDGGSTVEVKNSDGEALISFTAAKSFSSVCYSSDKLNEGETYIVYINGTKAAEAVAATTSQGGFGHGGGQRPSGMQGGGFGHGGMNNNGADKRVSVEINGSKMQFTDAFPYISNGTTLVPLRAVLEALGLNIEWDGETSTVTATNAETEIKLTIGSLTAYKDGQSFTLNTAPVIFASSTMVPIRFISESIGCSVEWDEAQQLVTIKEV